LEGVDTSFDLGDVIDWWMTVTLYTCNSTLSCIFNIHVPSFVSVIKF
jgi:hypothetical protein